MTSVFNSHTHNSRHTHGFRNSRRYRSEEALLRTARDVTNITLSLYFVRVHASFLQFLLNHYKYFTNVTSICIQPLFPEGLLGPPFWSKLEKGYQQLVSLRVVGCPIEMGTITLPNLQTLDIDLSVRAEWTVPQDFSTSFPRLKHLCIRFDEGTTAHYARLFSQNMSSLESLILWGPGPHNAYFLGREFPNLLLFGATTSGLQTVDFSFSSPAQSSLPSSVLLSSPSSPTSSTPSSPRHQLQHVWIVDSTKKTKAVAVKVVDSTPNLRHLSINSTNMSLISTHLLKRKCEKKGILLTYTI
jgi:hypothetical protein